MKDDNTKQNLISKSHLTPMKTINIKGKKKNKTKQNKEYINKN